MLLLALALASMTAAPAPDIQRHKRVKVVRARVPVRARPKARAAARDPNARYRLTGVTTLRADGKDLAVRNTGIPCGTVGAPVCPSNGLTVVDTANAP